MRAARVRERRDKREKMSEKWEKEKEKKERKGSTCTGKSRLDPPSDFLLSLFTLASSPFSSLCVYSTNNNKRPTCLATFLAPVAMVTTGGGAYRLNI